MELQIEGRESGAELAWSEPRAITRRVLDLSTLMEEFLQAQDIGANSKAVYRQGLQRLWSWLSENHIVQPDREDILRFKMFLTETGLRPNTVNIYLTATKRFFSYAEGRRAYPNVARDIKGIRQSKGHLREALTDSQVSEIINKIDLTAIHGLRDFAAVSLMASTGLRCCSVVAADLRDLVYVGKEAKLFYRGKGHAEKDQVVVVTEDALRPLQVYLKARSKVRPEEPLFVSHSDRNNGKRMTTATIRKAVKDLLREIGIDDPRLSAHSLRHFFATNALANGAHLLAVSRAMGHASIETTQIYLHELDRLGEGAPERFIKYERREVQAS